MSGVIDFGLPVSGLSGLTATGTNQATALPLLKRVNVFTSVPPGSGCVLPSAYAAGTSILVLNRDTQNLLVYPPGSDQIEGNGSGIPLSIAPGGNAELTSFDAPLSQPPRAWWNTTAIAGDI